MTTSTYAVDGLTCGHCVSAVAGELTSLDGVTNVSLELVAGGTSTVTISSAAPLSDEKVANALDEAGNYRLASAH
jgi:copper chaperone